MSAVSAFYQRPPSPASAVSAFLLRPPTPPKRADVILERSLMENTPTGGEKRGGGGLLILSVSLATQLATPTKPDMIPRWAKDHSDVSACVREIKLLHRIQGRLSVNER